MQLLGQKLNHVLFFSDKPSSWMTVDTSLFVMSAGETKEDSMFVCFTESKDKEVCLFGCVERCTFLVKFQIINLFFSSIIHPLYPRMTHENYCRSTDILPDTDSKSNSHF